MKQDGDLRPPPLSGGGDEARLEEAVGPGGAEPARRAVRKKRATTKRACGKRARTSSRKNTISSKKDLRPALTMEKLTEVERTTKLLKMEGYSVTTPMASEEFFKSKRWNAGGYDWEIHVHPKEYCGYPSYRKTLRLFFLGVLRTDNVKATFSCRLIDPSGNLNPSQEKRVTHKFERTGDSCLVWLESRGDLEVSGYLKDDSFTVQCTITLLKELPEIATSHRPANVAVPSSGLLRHLGELLQKETGADVTLVVSGESFAAHKIILASRSPVFMAEFFGHMKERSSQRVEIEDMEAATFKSMLQFIYTDSVPELDQQEGSIIAQHLLAAADRYGLDMLKLICEDKLSGGINVDAAATILALAEQHNCSQLKAKCVEFIAANVEAVMETVGYKHLMASCPLVLNDLLKAVVHERKN